MKEITIFLFLFLLLLSCDFLEPKHPVVEQDVLTLEAEVDSIFLPLYNPNVIQSIKMLPNKLNEISGLSFSDDKIYAINDEMGATFVLDKETGDIVDELKFASKGDFEGVEVLKNKVYTITSSGQLYIQKIKTKKVKVVKLDFSHANDIEGLGQLPGTNKLLVALKGTPAIGHKKEREREIYTLEMRLGKPKLKILWSIKPSSLEKWVKKNYKKKKEKELMKRMRGFSPSGIAFNPINSKIYILSSVGKSLVVLNATGKVKHIHFLDEKLHFQPEGICFDDAGNLYIADEGRGKSARLYRFEAVSNNQLNQ